MLCSESALKQCLGASHAVFNTHRFSSAAGPTDGGCAIAQVCRSTCRSCIVANRPLVLTRSQPHRPIFQRPPRLAMPPLGPPLHDYLGYDLNLISVPTSATLRATVASSSACAQAGVDPGAVPTLYLPEWTSAHAAPPRIPRVLYVACLVVGVVVAPL